MALHLNKLDPLHQGMLWAKLSWNGPMVLEKNFFYNIFFVLCYYLPSVRWKCESLWTDRNTDDEQKAIKKVNLNFQLRWAKKFTSFNVTWAKIDWMLFLPKRKWNAIFSHYLAITRGVEGYPSLTWRKSWNCFCTMQIERKNRPSLKYTNSNNGLNNLIEKAFLLLVN